MFEVWKGTHRNYKEAKKLMIQKFRMGIVFLLFSVLGIVGLMIIALIVPITQIQWGAWWACFIASWIGFIYSVGKLDKVDDYLRAKVMSDLVAHDLDIEKLEAEKREHEICFSKDGWPLMDAHWDNCDCGYKKAEPIDYNYNSSMSRNFNRKGQEKK